MTPENKISINVKEVAPEIFDFLGPLNDSQRDLVEAAMEVCHYYKNENIYSEHDTPRYMHILTHGKVKVFKNGVGGRHQIFRVIKPIEMFGYRAYFAHECYRTSASAFEHSVVVRIPMSTIALLLKENYHLNELVIYHLSVHLGVADDRTVNLTQKHIRGRLAEALLFLMDNYGVEEDGCTLSIYLSREDLANLSNMTTSNAIRTLSSFASEKMIAIDGKKIKILHQDELLHVSAMG